MESNGVQVYPDCFAGKQLRRRAILVGALLPAFAPLWAATSTQRDRDSDRKSAGLTSEQAQSDACRNAVIIPAPPPCGGSLLVQPVQMTLPQKLNAIPEQGSKSPPRKPAKHHWWQVLR